MQTTAGYGPRHERYSEVRIWDMETERVDQEFARRRESRIRLLGPFGGRETRSPLRSGSAAHPGDRDERARNQVSALPGCAGYPPAFSRDGAVVAMPILNSLALFDVRAGRRLHHVEGMPEGELIAASWSPSGDRIVTGHGDGGVRRVGRHDGTTHLAQALRVRRETQRLAGLHNLRCVFR